MKLGLIGLGKMGMNLALNMQDNGHTPVEWILTPLILVPPVLTGWRRPRISPICLTSCQHHGSCGSWYPLVRQPTALSNS